MAKPRRISFTELLEPVIAGAWDQNQSVLDDRLLHRTREAISYIRRVYRFKDEAYPSRLQYSAPKNRAGYLGAFGERHAYLAYQHLKEIERVDPDAIPAPDERGDLTITILGAGAALETYGVCLFYNESAHRLKRLRMNIVEKIEEWKPTRLTVLGAMLKTKFPKIRFYPKDIDADLTKGDCIQRFSQVDDELLRTSILLSYNVMNEIETRHAAQVWRNLKYMITQCERQLLILVAEPTAPKAWPRVNWLRQRLADRSRIVKNEPDAEIHFTVEPVRVALESTGKGLNDRLFGPSPNQSKPLLLTSLRRTRMACVVMPQSPITPELVAQQLESLKVKREKGRFVPRQPPSESPQLRLPGL